MPPLSPRVIATAQELAVAVPGLDTTDTVMAAHAVVDPNSAYLITRDGKLVANSAIERYEETARAQGRRKTKLEIVNPVETFPVF